MALTLQIKRSTGSVAPSSLQDGELAYTHGNEKLYIGDGSTVKLIGGKSYNDLIDHTAGTLTASSAVIVDSNNAISDFIVGNNGTTGGAIKFKEGTSNGTHHVQLKAPNSLGASLELELPGTDGTSGQFLATNGSGTLSFASVPSGTFTLSADSGADDSFSTGQVLTFSGGTGIDTTVSNNEITVDIDSTVATLTDTQTLTNKTLTAPVISSISNTGTLTLPTTTGTVALTSDIPTDNASLANGAGYMGMPQLLNPTSPYTLIASDAGKQASGFASVMKSISPGTINIGKPLPEDGLVMAENQQQQVQNDALQQVTESTVVRLNGEIRLLTGENQVSEESLLDFMNEQGLSRSEILAVLSNPDGNRLKKSKTTEDLLMTENWLQTKAMRETTIDGLLNESTETLTKPVGLILKEVLAVQLKTQLSRTTPSDVVELIGSKASIQHLANATVQDNGGGEPVFDFLELMDLARSNSDPETASQNQRETGSLFANSIRSSSETTMTQSELKDFRSFLADHLRRAETIQQLTDRLGAFVAKQVTAQISQGRWSVDLTLHPAELGSIKVDMEMTERGLEATFRASQAVTRDLLMESMPRLKQWFEEGGINVAYSGLSQDSGMNQSMHHEQANESAQSMNDSLMVAEPDQQAETNDVVGSGPGRLDIRV
ncbi:MAG: flagellar hook-length control protein FliK [Gammaproteobacteria bacterium]|nr:flagellar hook-length control protein FliK [Gammaproteobacteria bacterium]